MPNSSKTSPGRSLFQVFEVAVATALELFGAMGQGGGPTKPSGLAGGAGKVRVAAERIADAEGKGR